MKHARPSTRPFTDPDQGKGGPDRRMHQAASAARTHPAAAAAPSLDLTATARIEQGGQGPDPGVSR